MPSLKYYTHSWLYTAHVNWVLGMLATVVIIGGMEYIQEAVSEQSITTLNENQSEGDRADITYSQSQSIYFVISH